MPRSNYLPQRQYQRHSTILKSLQGIDTAKPLKSMLPLLCFILCPIDPISLGHNVFLNRSAGVLIMHFVKPLSDEASQPQPDAQQHQNSKASRISHSRRETGPHLCRVYRGT